MHFLKNLFVVLFLICFTQPLLAQDNSQEIEIKCIEVAQAYAQEHEGPWSADAKFGFRNKHICTVVVSQIGYDGQICYPSYSIDLKNWKVTQINYAGCIDQN